MYRVTASNIAYTILVYENGKEVWEEEWHIKKSISDDIQRKQAARHKNPSIMKDRESDSRGNVIASSNIDDRIKKHGEILSKNKMTFLA